MNEVEIELQEAFILLNELTDSFELTAKEHFEKVNKVKEIFYKCLERL